MRDWRESLSKVKQRMEQEKNVLDDLGYALRNWRMAKRIEFGESVTPALIVEKVKRLLTLPGLTRAQAKAVRDYFYPYKVSTFAVRDHLAVTDEFSPELMPSEMYYAYVDHYYNRLDLAPALENKCVFSRLYPDIPQPDMVLSRMNGYWFAEGWEPVSEAQAMALLDREENLFVKQATDSFGGIGVRHIVAAAGKPSLSAQFREAEAQMKGDLLVQRTLRQHPDVARLNPNSVNTMRIVSFLDGDQVKVLFAMLRCSSDRKSVDNYTSGGMLCIIQKDGTLSTYAISQDEKYTAHPLSGVVFEGYQLPSFDRALTLVRTSHRKIPYFRMVAWDVAIREDGEPVMIEANLTMMGLSMQRVYGSLFGRDTKRVADQALADSDFPRYHNHLFNRRKDQ